MCGDVFSRFSSRVPSASNIQNVESKKGGVVGKRRYLMKKSRGGGLRTSVQSNSVSRAIFPAILGAIVF